MSQPLSDLQRSTKKLSVLYAPVAEHLRRVEDILRGQLASNNPFIDKLAKHGFRLGGKRLRPALVLLAGKVCGSISPRHHVVAAAIELIHTASLVHDDVLDDATLRRHLETVNARWDNEASVLFGDYLFARAMHLASSLSDPYIVAAVTEAGRVMCEGELCQVANRGNYALEEGEYLQIIAAKTAALYSCACHLGAYCAGASSETTEALTMYGRQLGTAFQIVDDLLDLLGNEATTGKSLGTDLVKQKPTLPLIRLLSQLDESAQATLLGKLADPAQDKRRVLRPWLERYDALSYAREKAAELVHAACGHLAQLPDGPATESLRAIAEFVLTRQH